MVDTINSIFPTISGTVVIASPGFVGIGLLDLTGNVYPPTAVTQIGLSYDVTSLLLPSNSSIAFWIFVEDAYPNVQCVFSAADGVTNSSLELSIVPVRPGFYIISCKLIKLYFRLFMYTHVDHYFLFLILIIV